MLSKRLVPHKNWYSAFPEPRAGQYLVYYNQSLHSNPDHLAHIIHEDDKDIRTLLTYFFLTKCGSGQKKKQQEEVIFHRIRFLEIGALRKLVLSTFFRK